MTQKERIEQLEREVADLRALVDVLRTVPRPFNPVPFNPVYAPQPQPQTPRWPAYPQSIPPYTPTYIGPCS